VADQGNAVTRPNLQIQQLDRHQPAIALPDPTQQHHRRHGHTTTVERRRQQRAPPRHPLQVVVAFWLALDLPVIGEAADDSKPSPWPPNSNPMSW
jgi:hypothetical protein